MSTLDFMEDEEWEETLKKRQEERKRRQAERDARRAQNSQEQSNVDTIMEEIEIRKKKRKEERERRREERERLLEEQTREDEKVRIRQEQRLQERLQREKEEEEKKYQSEAKRLKEERAVKRALRLELLSEDKEEEAKKLEEEEKRIRAEMTELKTEKLQRMKVHEDDFDKEQRVLKTQRKRARDTFRRSMMVIKEEEEKDTNDDDEFLLQLQEVEEIQKNLSGDSTTSPSSTSQPPKTTPPKSQPPTLGINSVPSYAPSNSPPPSPTATTSPRSPSKKEKKSKKKEEDNPTKPKLLDDVLKRRKPASKEKGTSKGEGKDKPKMGGGVLGTIKEAVTPRKKKEEKKEERKEEKKEEGKEEKKEERKEEKKEERKEEKKEERKEEKKEERKEEKKAERKEEKKEERKEDKKEERKEEKKAERKEEKKAERKEEKKAERKEEKKAERKEEKKAERKEEKKEERKEEKKEERKEEKKAERKEEKKEERKEEKKAERKEEKKEERKEEKKEEQKEEKKQTKEQPKQRKEPPRPPSSPLPPLPPPSSTPRSVTNREDLFSKQIRSRLPAKEVVDERKRRNRKQQNRALRMRHSVSVLVDHPKNRGQFYNRCENFLRLLERTTETQHKEGIVAVAPAQSASASVPSVCYPPYPTTPTNASSAPPSAFPSPSSFVIPSSFASPSSSSSSPSASSSVPSLASPSVISTERPFFFDKGDKLKYNIQSLLNFYSETPLTDALFTAWSATWGTLQEIQTKFQSEQEEKFPLIEKMAPYQRLSILDLDPDTPLFSSPIALPSAPSTSLTSSASPRKENSPRGLRASCTNVPPTSHSSNAGLVQGLGRLKSGERVWMKGVDPRLITEGGSGGKWGEEVKKQLLQEALLLASMTSMYVPLFFGACFSISCPFLVMEYAPSFSLASILEANLVGVAGMRGKKRKDEMESLFGCVQMVQPWENRWQLLVDTVVGLSVLHRHIHAPIVHGSVNSLHVLLDKTTIRGKLCGFTESLSSLSSLDSTPLSVEELERGKKEDLKGLARVLVEISHMKPMKAVLGEEKERGMVGLLDEGVSEEWKEVVTMCEEGTCVGKLIDYLKEKKKIRNKFVQQKSESKKLKEKMKTVSSEIEIQDQLLEVVERNACLAEKRAHQEETDYEVLVAELEIVNYRVKNDKEQTKELEEKEKLLKEQIIEAQSKERALQREATSSKMNAMKKELRKEIDQLEETKDEDNRCLTRLRSTKRQTQRDIDDLETELAVLKRRLERLNPDSLFLSPNVPREKEEKEPEKEKPQFRCVKTSVALSTPKKEEKDEEEEEEELNLEKRRKERERRRKERLERKKEREEAFQKGDSQE